MKVLEHKKVLLIVGGGIAAYKAPMVVRALVKAGAEVRCVMTRGAASFVTPMSLQAVSRHRVGQDLLSPEEEDQIGHIELARWADAVLVAPATANLMARMAAGMANDLATTVLLATNAPVLVAPAMNTQMLQHPATRRNIETLRAFGHVIIPSDSGELACQEVGEGRQPDPEVLTEFIGRRLSSRPLEGKRVVVTAGPTRAFMDPVRFISNPSTGKMGVALARAAGWLGASPVLIAGPGVEVPPEVALTERINVETAGEMADAVLARVEEADWLFMAAAVGDWEPVDGVLEKKRKKRPDSHEETWALQLRRTRDILSLAAAHQDDSGRHRVVVGFAAETHHLEKHARQKLKNKGCDVILGNWVRSGNGDTFGSDSVELRAFGRDGWAQTFGPDLKFSVAMEVLAALATRFGVDDD